MPSPVPSPKTRRGAFVALSMARMPRTVFLSRPGSKMVFPEGPGSRKGLSTQGGPRVFLKGFPDVFVVAGQATVGLGPAPIAQGAALCVPERYVRRVDFAYGRRLSRLVVRLDIQGVGHCIGRTVLQCAQPGTISFAAGRLLPGFADQLIRKRFIVWGLRFL